MRSNHALPFSLHVLYRDWVTTRLIIANPAKRSLFSFHLGRATVADYHTSVLNYARKSITENLRKVGHFNALHQDGVYDASVEILDFDVNNVRVPQAFWGADTGHSGAQRAATASNATFATMPPPGTPESRKEALSHASAALNAITLNSRKRRGGSGKHASPQPYYLSRAQPVPKYDAWVPVNEEFWISSEFMVQPYMPWDGDDPEQEERALELYKKMAKESTEVDADVSDGEIDSDGCFIEPADDVGWQHYDSTAEQHRRRACREALVAVCSKFSRANPVVLDAAAQALHFTTRARTLKVLEVAESRFAQASAAAVKWEAARREAKRMNEAWLRDTGVGDMDDDQYADEARLPLEHFCFTCHVFLCPRHKGHNVEPVLPIKDLYVENRAAALKKLKAGGGNWQQACNTAGLTPCGADCYLSPPHAQVPLKPGEEPEGVWTKEERILLRESVAIFKRDSCSVAKIIGPSKSCRQTAAFMQIPSVDKALKAVVNEATSKRTNPEYNRGRGSNTQVEDKRELAADSSGARERKAKNAKSVGKKASGRQSDDGDGDEELVQEADFKPCLHQGPCDSKCPCVIAQLKCEATCGCNTGRWTARGFETPGSTGGKLKLCNNRDWGCVCPVGSHCNTEACACWVNQRSCDPDFCDHCQANALPSQIMSDNRNCRNVGVLTKRHKKTFIGNSSVHGYGLYAGEVFEEGDLVGIYGGGIMDTIKADTIGHMYDYKDHTFFFDVTQSLVVDGGMLGMKSKFVNHVAGGSPKENCHSRCVRVRGMAHIALFAKRRVEVGEEFMFDYKFQEKIPEWARKAPPTPDQAKPERAKSERPGRYGNKSGRKQAGSSSVLASAHDDSALMPVESNAPFREGIIPELRINDWSAVPMGEATAGQKKRKASAPVYRKQPSIGRPPECVPDDDSDDIEFVPDDP